jgi:hypothetical protein
MPEDAETPLVRQCGAMEVYYRQLETFPALRQGQVALHAATSRRMAAPVAARAGVTRIPVVVHVVYSKASENITTTQIKSQITVLNRDFRAKNPDRSKVPVPWLGLVADTRVEFLLAKTAPDGKATNGITRTKTTRTSFGLDDSVKSSTSGGADPWPTDRYLNIWVCRLAGSLLGYAQFPGGPAETDGVVILNTAFGTKGTARAPFNLGRSCTHEVGHWLNLRHIWADTEDCSGTDYVDDTPNCAGPNYDKPEFPHVSCNNGPNGDMFMNYMDYVDDDSMFFFTPQQVMRMQTALDVARPTIGQ